jgi:hypothetical protein
VRLGEDPGAIGEVDPERLGDVSAAEERERDDRMRR